MIDLHIHSEASIDAADTPEKILAHASAQGIRTISLTEHENTNSLRQVQQLARSLGLEAINGIEFGSAITVAGRPVEVHLLGYFFRDYHPHILDLANQYAAQSILETEAFLCGLAVLGIPVTDALVRARYPGKLSAWAIRRVLREEKIAADKPQAVSIERQAIQAAIEKETADAFLIRPMQLELMINHLRADGAMIYFAHPFWLTKPSRGKCTEAEVWTTIEKMIDLGVDGIEAYNTHNDAGYGSILQDFCRGEGLPASGGSDSHGAGSIGMSHDASDLYASMLRHRNGRSPWDS